MRIQQKPYGQLFCTFLLFIPFIPVSDAKIHFLSLTDDARRNILLSKFGYSPNGTFDFALANFTVPDAVINAGQDKFGIIGFTLSRGKVIAEAIRTTAVCQLQQQDQGIDALFFVFDFAQNVLIVTRSGHIQDLTLCPSSTECPSVSEAKNLNPAGIEEKIKKPVENKGIFDFLKNFGSKEKKVAYLDFIPLTSKNGQYSAQFGIRFNERQRGLYQLIYHNCFNYRAHGFSDRVAVDFAVTIVERNLGSYLSAGDIPKPTLYLYMAFLFALATILWCNVLWCKSDPRNIFKVHRLMTALVILKTLSLLFHGVNFYFVSVYGHQREIWAIIFYITHLLKGALLFGTIILIGTGYTFFKNFLSDRDRNLFMVVLPLQVIDNIAMVIIEESEFGEQRYYFWFEIFVFLDLVCCMAIIWPVVWSMRHLQDGARTDGKAAFNLEKLRLFRHFYVIVIAYIYATRVTKFVVEFFLPFDYQWVSEAIVELSTLFFFCLVGAKFRPLKANPYLKLTQEDGEANDAESGIALTTNGLYENVSRVQRINVTDELNDIPGGIGGHGASDSSSEDEAMDEEEKDCLLPKTGRDMGLLTL